MSGLEVLKIILQKFPNCRYFCFTAQPIEFGCRALRRGATDYLLKTSQATGSDRSHAGRSANQHRVAQTRASKANEALQGELGALRNDNLPQPDLISHPAGAQMTVS